MTTTISLCQILVYSPKNIIKAANLRNSVCMNLMFLYFSLLSLSCPVGAQAVFQGDTSGSPYVLFVKLINNNCFSLMNITTLSLSWSILFCCVTQVVCLPQWSCESHYLGLLSLVQMVLKFEILSVFSK